MPSSRHKREAGAKTSPSSPSATGPAGATLEGHVGAQYLLPMLTGGNARGLPGAVITRVSFQRGASGFPMDDVIVSGVDGQGQRATLEIQAKRTLTFTASDETFGDVVALACHAAQQPEFNASRHELAVALARTSTKIEQYIQVVLRWARDYQDVASFFQRLNQRGAAHQAMRDFVLGFRDNMRAAGMSNDEASVKRILSRFQVLAFDLESPGSLSLMYARERCSSALHASEFSRAAELWDTLAQIALEVDAAGGDLDSESLRQRIAERNFRLAGDRRLYQVKQRLAESADHALSAIKTTVCGVRLDRAVVAAQAELALEKGRYLEIRGSGGVGKSAVLKEIALTAQIESRVIVLAPDRTPSGGWSALQSQIGCDFTARELLVDLAGDGGATLFIDGIDRFEDPGQRHTIADLLTEAANVPGVCVIATARSDFDSDARSWMPDQAIERLGAAPPLVVEELNDEEVSQLRQADYAKPRY